MLKPALRPDAFAPFLFNHLSRTDFALLNERNLIDAFLADE